MFPLLTSDLVLLYDERMYSVIPYLQIYGDLLMVLCSVLVDTCACTPKITCTQFLILFGLILSLFLMVFSRLSVSKFCCWIFMHCWRSIEYTHTCMYVYIHIHTLMLFLLHTFQTQYYIHRFIHVISFWNFFKEIFTTKI